MKEYLIYRIDKRCFSIYAHTTSFSFFFYGPYPIMSGTIISCVFVLSLYYTVKFLREGICLTQEGIVLAVVSSNDL